jgi:PleD family two-component response regulator
LESVYKLVELLTYIKNIHVLVVEDSITCSSQLKKILNNILINTTIAKNGQEALEILEKDKSISLLISDFNMPKMNGLELLKILRKDARLSAIPALIISSVQDDELKIQLYKNGANDIISKPFWKMN